MSTTTTPLLPPDTVPFSTPPEKLAARQRSLKTAWPAPWRLLAALLTLAVAVPVWLLLIVETLRRAWEKGSLYAALAPPRDPDALEKQKRDWPFPVRTFSVAVEGGRVRLGAVELVSDNADETAADDPRPLALFLHGFPEAPYSWRFVMPAFSAKGYRCVALTLRGYHGSDAPEGIARYTLRRLADDVRDAAAALGFDGSSPQKRVTLVAHDWGGSIAWTTAALHGERLVERMVVLALPPLQLFGSNFTPRQALRSLYILRFQLPWLPEASLLADDAKVVGLCFTAPPIGVVACEEGGLSEGDVAVYRHSFAQPGRATCALHYYRALVRWSLASALPECALRFLPRGLLADFKDEGLAAALRKPLHGIPVLLLHGEQDVALGVGLMDGWEAVAAHPDSRAFLLGRCSHWINQDRPRAVNELVAAWL